MELAIPDVVMNLLLLVSPVIQVVELEVTVIIIVVLMLLSHGYVQAVSLFFIIY